MLLLHSTWGKVLLKFLILFYFSPKLHSNCAPTYFSNSRCRSRTSFGEKLAKEREVQRIQLQPEMDRAIRLPILPILPILPKLPNIAKSCQHPLNPAKICQILPKPHQISVSLNQPNNFFIFCASKSRRKKRTSAQNCPSLASHYVQTRTYCQPSSALQMVE